MDCGDSKSEGSKNAAAGGGPNRPGVGDRERIQHVVYFWLYHTYAERFDHLIIQGLNEGGPLRALFYKDFCRDWQSTLGDAGLGGDSAPRMRPISSPSSFS